MVKQGNIVVFHEDGGSILHKQSGRRINFSEREGVYTVEMKLPGFSNDDSMDVDTEPMNVDTHQDMDRTPGFTRPER